MNPINHVAIIMDGNGRWGIRKKNSRNYGHQEGLKTLEKIIFHSIKRKVPYLTLFTFSSENWKRPKKEVNFLFKLLENYFKKKLSKVINKKIKIKIIGNKNKLSKKLRDIIKVTEKKTSNNENISIQLALNYGSKDEIINCFKKINKKKQKITEKNIRENLYTNNIPDPDILIRTGGTKRLSNFLLWQLAYTEIFFINKMWPEFNQIDFDKIINRYKKIKRNFGTI